MNQANKEEAEKCLRIARAALEAGNDDKAKRFADKALKLYPTDEARVLLCRLEARSASTPGPSSSSAPAGASSAQHRDSDPRPSAAGMRHRQNKPKEEEEAPEPADVTQEQRDMVKKIRESKDYYAILDIAKDASDDDIKKAYRKLALKLHPDKNKAKGSDEAFKAVSRAFSCLSDSDKRAAYDRYGHEDGAMAARQAAGQARPGGVYRGEEDFDPEEIFNMFFGGGFGPQFGHTRVYTFGGMPRRRQQQQHQGPQQAPHPLAGLVQFLPLLLILLLTFFNQQPDPVYSLHKSAQFPDLLHTERHNVQFFVNLNKFKKDHPTGSHQRAQAEAHVERAFKEILEERCYQERMQQQRMRRWNYQKAKEMQLPNCEEINRVFGVRYWNT